MGSTLALAIFLSVSYLGWTGQRAYVGGLNATLYYLCPLAVAVLLLASLRIATVWKVQLVLLCISTTVSVYGLELLLERYFSSDAAARSVMIRLADTKNKTTAATELARRFGVKIDPRTADEVIADLRAQGVDALPIITPANHLIAQPDGSIKSAVAIDGKEVLPLAAVSNTVTVLCNEGGQWIDYRSDQRGFSNANESRQSGRPGHRRTR